MYSIENGGLSYPSIDMLITRQWLTDRNASRIMADPLRAVMFSVPYHGAQTPEVTGIVAEWDAYYTAPFLSSFFFRSDIDTDVTRALDHPEYGDRDELRFDIDLSILHALPKNRAVVLPILACVDAIEVEHTCMERYVLSGRTPTGHTVRLTGRVHHLEMYKYFHSFSDLAQAFRGAPVVRLFLNGNRATAVSKAHWQATLEAFLLIEEIVIAHTDSFTYYDARVAILAALHPRPRTKENPYPNPRDALLAQ